jgi:hypothetical protein
LRLPNAAEQLTTTAMQNQQLSKTVDDLKDKVQQVSEEEAGKNKRSSSCKPNWLR